MNAIRERFPTILGITRTGQYIVATQGNAGIAFQCCRMGENGFARDYIRPDNVEALLRSEHHNPEPTFYYQPLGYVEPPVQIPIQLSRLLLYQRLLRFTEYGPHERDYDRDLRDIEDIQFFLQVSVLDDNRPFAPEIASRLSFFVRRWILFAENNFVHTTRADIDAWRRLGLTLTYEDASELYR